MLQKQSQAMADVILLEDTNDCVPINKGSSMPNLWLNYQQTIFFILRSAVLFLAMVPSMIIVTKWMMEVMKRPKIIYKRLFGFFSDGAYL